MKNLLIAFCAILLIAVSCKKPDINRDINGPLEYEVPAEFQVYVDTFLSAGIQRGDTVLINNLVVDWEQPDEDLGGHTCAVCAQAKDEDIADTLQKFIIINKECWDGRDAYGKERIMLHELGHCYLGRRDHTNGTLSNGDRASLMYKQMVDSLWTDSSLYKREYYLDELFDEETPEPWWSQ